MSEKPPICGKGIIQQMEESIDTQKNTLPMTRKEFVKWFNDAEKDWRKEQNRKKKLQKKHILHLAKRSRELGKDIPIEVMFFTDPFLNPGCLVGSWFNKKFKEWL